MFILFRYSYVGQLQHNNENIAESEAKLVSYTKQKWAYGSVVGVYLNRWQGTLAFYLDRQLLGIAFRGNLISFVIEKIFLNQKSFCQLQSKSYLCITFQIFPKPKNYTQCYPLQPPNQK